MTQICDDCKHDPSKKVSNCECGCHPKEGSALDDVGKSKVSL